jgi:hypothetical protein
MILMDLQQSSEDTLKNRFEKNCFEKIVGR